MLRNVALIRTEVSEEPFISIISVTRIGEVRKTLDVSSNRSTLVTLPNVLQFLVTANFIPSSPILVTLMMETIRAFVTTVLTTSSLRNIPEGGILHNKNYLEYLMSLFNKRGLCLQYAI
jgi:hypothetical protein